jgi:hypothetical protein
MLPLVLCTSPPPQLRPSSQHLLQRAKTLRHESYIHFCSALAESALIAWPLKMWPLYCPETSVSNSQPTPYDIPPERRTEVNLSSPYGIRVFVFVCVCVCVCVYIYIYIYMYIYPWTFPQVGFVLNACLLQISTYKCANWTKEISASLHLARDHIV